MNKGRRCPMKEITEYPGASRDTFLVWAEKHVKDGRRYIGGGKGA